MSIKIEFINRNLNEDGIRVYRSHDPISPDSIPSDPLTTLLPGTTEFVDDQVILNAVYYYLFETFRGSEVAYSEVVKVHARVNTGPGPQELIGGNLSAGFYGEVPASELINGVDLATRVGLTAGTAQHSNEPWLKFVLDGKTLFVNKKTIRHSISWNSLNAVGAVYGDKVVGFGGSRYKVRLLKGANSDPTTAVSRSYDHPSTHGSEWNRLMYHVSGRPFADPSNTLASEGIEEGDWAQYTETDLVTHQNGGNGSATWCQESQGGNRVYHGYSGVSFLFLNTASDAGAALGWRACLELIVE